MGATRVPSMSLRWGKSTMKRTILTIVEIVTITVLTVRLNDAFPGAAAQVYAESCQVGVPACTSRIAHAANGMQSVSDLATLYDVSISDIVGANNIDLSEEGLLTMPFTESNIVLIPLPCDCIDRTRRTNTTVYTVKSGDTLSMIAEGANYFQHLTTYQEIGGVNGIVDLNQIVVGQNLVIPFPCACRNNTNGGAPAVFVTYVVQLGDDLGGIASMFGASAADVAAINQIVDVSNIQALNRLVVPLAACASDFERAALDYGLLVTNGSYSLSPGAGCVQSSCYGYPTLGLYSSAASIRLNASSECPTLECSNMLGLGRFTTTPSGTTCSVTSCEYRGYPNSTTIFTSLETSTESTCPVANPAPPEREVGGAPGPMMSLPPPPTPGAQPSGGANTALDSRVLLRSFVGVVFSFVIPLYLCFFHPLS